jgi:hypothetical protein
MPITIDDIEEAIADSVRAGFRDNLLARGQARSIIWRDGTLPEDAPQFSPRLSYDLLTYGYTLLNLGIRLLELGGNQDASRQAFEHAASAIEAVIAKGDQADPSNGFHHVIAAAAYHLGRFSARAYSLLARILSDANISPTERCLSLLILRRLDALETLIADWR